MKLLITLLFPIALFAQTKDSVFNYLQEIGVKHPEIVTAQSLEETGNYKCTNCSLNRNNIFGFRYKKKYLQFDNWKASCDYYLRWQTKWYKGQNYYEFLNCIFVRTDGKCARYATKKGYINRIKQLAK